MICFERVNTNDKWSCNRCGCTHTHTHTDTLLKNKIMILACNVIVAGVFFCTQNLIRDG